MTRKSSELDEIKKTLGEMNAKLDQLVKHQVELARLEFVPTTLESLPTHLKGTALAIATMGKATAEQVAAKTGRTRAAESDYLNQLASRGYLRKERRGRQVEFLVFSLFTKCPQCATRVLMTLNYCTNCGTSLTPQEKRHQAA